MKRLRPACLLAVAPLALSAQAPAWQPQVAAVWSEAQGGLKDVTSEHALGLLVGAQVQENPQGALRVFAEYRRVFSGDSRYSLADAGFDLTGAINGPLYGFIGTSAERIHLPRRDPATKLGWRGGMGWSLSQRFGLEATYTTASLDHRSVNSLDFSLRVTF
ncbi:MAG TPA: hypothetical protein VL181_08890 [Holophagaceae bacterium]|nr:hypothetical protein [Holophagaceae bacterium]